MFWNKNKEKKELPKMRLQIIQADFKTVDGELHSTCKHGWFNVSDLMCTAGEYIMIDIEDDGYIQDGNGVMYPLANVVSIKWNIVDEKEIEDYWNNDYHSPIYTQKEIEQLSK